MQEHEQSQTTPIPDSNEVSATTIDNYNNPELDDIYPEAVRFVTESRIASVSAVQKKSKIGYHRSSTIIEAMEAMAL